MARSPGRPTRSAIVLVFAFAISDVQAQTEPICRDVQRAQEIASQSVPAVLSCALAPISSNGVESLSKEERKAISDLASEIGKFNENERVIKKEKLSFGDFWKYDKVEVKAKANLASEPGTDMES